jgi:alkylmercury lyase
MSIDAAHLATRLRETISSTSSADDDADAMGWLWPALLRALARGRPVTVDDLAQVTGRSAAQVRDGLAGLSDTEYDEQGAVIGHGITLRETPHQFSVDGQRLYTWCALDTLIFPSVLGRRTQVVSPTPGSGELVQLSVDPNGWITALEPATRCISSPPPPLLTAGSPSTPAPPCWPSTTRPPWADASPRT